VSARTFRYAVVGAGAIGSAAAYWLSRAAGEQVVCLEQYELGHGLGASEDHSRIIRLGYHAERYTALTRAAYDAWRVVAEESGVPLVRRTGMVNIADAGTEGGAILDAYVDAMDAQEIGYERLSAAQLTERWPQFRIPAGHEGLFQAEGGILDVRRAVAVQLALARSRGAAIVPGARVQSIRSGEAGVELVTPAGTYRADQVVICAGAWTAGLLRTLGVDWPIRLTRQQVTYFATPHLARFAPERFPIWIWHGEDEHYGFPVYGEVATKAARENLGEATIDLATWDRRPEAAEVESLARFLERILPGYTGPQLATRSCLYDLPPDRDFVLDLVPGHPRLATAIGAGHAAKFAGLLGRILAELTLDGATRFPIAGFRADRPALTDPGFAPAYRLGGTAVAA
jgi:monomeric sarcosine oxidase